VYAELVERLGFSRPKPGTVYPVAELLPQVVVGHRLWCEATARRERFVGLEKVQIMQDKDASELWLRLYLSRADLDRYGISHKRLVREGGLEGQFREVEIGLTTEDLDWICLEQISALSYPGRAIDSVPDLVAPSKVWLWRILTTVPDRGYRKYYLHLTPPSQARVPQIASLWVLTYYFGSIVRYRPHEFDAIAAGRYGAFVVEFISAQSEQLLYMLASEMCRREVVKPAVI
jgi:hypothetical protein